jgi:hypothetical protein
MFRKYVLLLLLCLFSTLSAQEKVDLQTITKIKQEGFKNSQVMDILSYLTDVHGPRLTGSPNLRKAQDWAVEKLSEWGLSNVHTEQWGVFGSGWEVVRFSAEMTSPQYVNLIAYPQAWTPGTDGVITGQPVLIDPDKDDFEEEYAGKLEGAIVLIGSPREANDDSEPDEKRKTDEQLDEIFMAETPGGRPANYERIQQWRKRRATYEKLNKFLLKEGAKVVLRSSQLDHGTLRVMSGGSFKTAASRSMPSLIVAMEHYNRIARLIEKEIPVTLSINIETRFIESDSLEYNVIAEIPGTDRKLKKEIVMLGAHMDSWHSATGATDNGAGTAAMMEAMRILKAIDAKPRRTIRLALWTGEEQGLLGSRGYVKKHFADPETMELKPEHELLSAYYNIDNGGGKIRGIYLQENDAARPIFEAMLKPFEDLGVQTVTIRNTGGTDHLSFDRVGLPGFQFIQDELDYFTRTWHTNMDVYDHVKESDMMQISVVVASVVLHTANRDEKIPRKPLPKAKK